MLLSQSPLPEPNVEIKKALRITIAVSPEDKTDAWMDKFNSRLVLTQSHLKSP